MNTDLPTRDVFDALRWAYCEELPKAGRDSAAGMARGWDRVGAYGQLGTIVDEPNRYGVVPSSGGDGVPHPDAVTLAEAVAALQVVVDWREWSPFGDCADVVGGDGLGVSRQVLGALDLRDLGEVVRRSAVSGSPPDWRAPMPTRAPRLAANGRPVWLVDRVAMVDGVGRVVAVPARKGAVGAYQPMDLDWNAARRLCEARARYVVWWLALDRLATTRLQAMRLIHRRPSAPWLSTAQPSRRVLEVGVVGAVGVDTRLVDRHRRQR